MRGTLPKTLLRQVAATYHQVWWPHFHTPIYTPANTPRWDEAQGAYVDPKTHEPLPTWAHALTPTRG